MCIRKPTLSLSPITTACFTACDSSASCHDRPPLKRKIRSLTRSKDERVSAMKEVIIWRQYLTHRCLGKCSSYLINYGVILIPCTSREGEPEGGGEEQEENWPQKPAATKACLVTKSVIWSQQLWSQKGYLATNVVTMVKL